MLSLSDFLAFLTRRRIIVIGVWVVLVIVFLSLLDLKAYRPVKGFLQPAPKPPLPDPPKVDEEVSVPGTPATSSSELVSFPPASTVVYYVGSSSTSTQPTPSTLSTSSIASTPSNSSKPSDGKFLWQDLPIHYPVTSLIPLPTGDAVPIPRIQHVPGPKNSSTEAIRLRRLSAVKQAFQHAWKGYSERAWLADEVGPLSGERHNFFGGWAASLVDALDTLWIMDMKDDFAEAVKALDKIDFTKTEQTELNMFETTIRYMGGFLGAYDISNSEYPLLLSKAKELGEMLLVAFDTPNRMPMTRWDWQKSRNGEKMEAGDNVLAAEMGSLTLELTRLSQITGDGRYYDAVQRIMDQFDKQQMKTQLPGMWPWTLNAKTLDFRSDTAYTVGAPADSLYEYLPKEHLLLGGRTDQYSRLYNRAADVFKEHNFYRPMTKDQADILFSALVRTQDDGSAPVLDNSMQHLVCFAGGMVAMGAKIFNRTDDLSTAQKLVDGCIWAYDSMPNGLMPEAFHFTPCPAPKNSNSSNSNATTCEWDEDLWHTELMTFESDSDRASPTPYSERLAAKIASEHLPPGYTAINDRHYNLRPEAIESIFIWYRITGDTSYQDKAWKMFEAVEKATRTEIAYATVGDVTAEVVKQAQADRMESFWMAETLKYFYLVFAEGDVVSLEDYVLNTEAHPFLRPKG